MSNDIKVTDGTILEALNGKIDYDGGNYAGSGLETIVNNHLAENTGLNNKITNCLLEVPQRIKLELVDGTLTLKAGSEVIIPNGFEADGKTPKFDYYTMPSDRSGATGGSQLVYCYNPSKNIWGASAQDACSSGDTAPTSPVNNHYWYDTANNIVKRWSNNAWVGGYSLPVCLSSKTLISQIFNGIGYIGSTVFVDKGVKGLIPNGRNEDGSLNNKEFITDKLLINTYTSANGSFVLRINDGKTVNATSDVVYDEVKNLIYVKNTTYPSTVIGDIVYSNGVITSFQPKLPFRAVDYNDKSTIMSWGMPDYSTVITVAIGATFTAPSNGLLFWNNSKTDNATVNGNTVYIGGNDSYNEGPAVLPLSKGDKATFTADSGTPCFVSYKGGY